MRGRWAMLALLAVVGCSRTAPGGPVLHQIRIVGASAGLPFAEDVAERFTLSGGDTIAPLAQAAGTTSGVARFCGGLGAAHPDLVVATRPMTRAERADCAAHGVHAIAEVPFGWSALVLVAGAGGPVALSRAEVAAAIAGPARRWSDLDPALPAGPILLYGPPPAIAGGDGFPALLGGAKTRIDGAYHALGADAALVARTVARTPGAVGLVPFAYAWKTGLRPVAIDGVAPDATAIARGRYPLRLPLILLVKSAEARAVPGMPTLLGLFSHAIAPGGAFAAEGLVPLDAAGRDAARRLLASASAAA